MAISFGKYEKNSLSQSYFIKGNLNNYNGFKIDCFISIFWGGFHSIAKYALNSLFQFYFLQSVQDPEYINSNWTCSAITRHIFFPILFVNSSLKNNVLLFYIAKYNFKATVWYLHQSYQLHTMEFKSHSSCVNKIKTGSKLKTSSRHFSPALL